MDKKEEIDIICKERNHIDSYYRAYVAIAIQSVENILNGCKLLIVHQYLDYLEGKPTILRKFFDIFNKISEIAIKKEAE